MRDGLRGFASLRTRPGTPMDPALRAPERFCERCGARLRRSNPGPLCMPCTQQEPVQCPEWMMTLADFDSRPATVTLLAALLIGSERRTVTQERNESIKALYEAGKHSREQLADLYGLSKESIRCIVTGKGY